MPEGKIDPEVIATLAPLMGGGIPWNDINLTVQRIPGGPNARVPQALARRPVMAVTRAGVGRELIAVGMAIGNDVFIDPSHADFSTAAGLALLGHEAVHVRQEHQVLNFEDAYSAEAERTPFDQPWLNRYEKEAYVEEANLYCALVREGWPKGKWEPLGVSLWGC